MQKGYFEQIFQNITQFEKKNVTVGDIFSLDRL